MEIAARNPHVVQVTTCETTDRAVEELACLRDADSVAIDTETEIERDDEGNIIPRDFDVEGPGPWRVMSLAARFTGPSGPEYRSWVLDMKYVDARALKPLLEDIRPWGWNANFDRFVLRRGGLTIGKWWDGMLFDAVLKTGAYYATGGKAWYTSLEVAGAKWADVPGIEGKSDTRYWYTMEPEHLSETEVRYAADDAIVTLWVSEALVPATQQAGLYETAVRVCNAQPFVDSMAKNGVALDVADYQSVVDNAQHHAAAAAERIAIETTGKQLLDTVSSWAELQTAPEIIEVTEKGNSEATGLTVLKTPKVFAMFIAAVKAQLDVCTEQMAKLTGAVEPVEDLFSDHSSWQAPFDPDSDVEVKRWISKNLPEFTAAYIESIGAKNKQLVKAHNIADVLAVLSNSNLDSVTDSHRQLAVVLASYRRYAAIVADYGDTIGEVWLKPDWNVNSGPELKAMLNQYAADEVNTYTTGEDGFEHQLGPNDSVDSDALTLMGGPLCKALLAYREHNKMVTTYGADLLDKVHPVTGRIHGKYLQALTGTGRLSSYSPNMQNLSPLMKEHAHPPLDGGGRVVRATVQADLSQAELRLCAHLSDDKNMLEAFASGVDLHERTASLMFDADMGAVHECGSQQMKDLAGIRGMARFVDQNPGMPANVLYAALRSKAKGVSFGYAYGLAAASLAHQQTVRGMPTTKEEAAGLLSAFDNSYPQLAAWMKARVDFISSLSTHMKDLSKPSGCDFERSLLLHRLYGKCWRTQKTLSQKLGRKATAREIAEHLSPEDDVRANIASTKFSGMEISELIAALNATSPGMPDAEAMLALHREETIPSGHQQRLWELISERNLHERVPVEVRNSDTVLRTLAELLVTDSEVDATRTEQVAQTEWALGHYGATVLTSDGEPWSFESRTPGGRRRLFQVGTKDWILAMVGLVVRSRKRHSQQVRDAWVEHYNARVLADHENLVASGKRSQRAKAKTVSLTKRGKSGKPTALSRDELKKVFDGDEIKMDFIEFVIRHYENTLGAGSSTAVEYLFRYGMADRIRAMGNQYRNHPIQGGVADGVEGAYSVLYDELTERFPTAKAIQSVHDSIVIECDIQDAKEIRDLLVSVMEREMSALCPSVVVKADGDITLSLAGSTALSDEEVDGLVSQLYTNSAAA